MGTLEINKMLTHVKDKEGENLNYENVVGRMSVIEEDIGLSLAKNSQLTGLAAKIQKYSGVGSYVESSTKIKTKVDGDVDKIGGALSFQQGWGTLGGSVNAVMNEIESTQDSKLEYSISHTADHPYFPTGAKKPEFDAKIGSLSGDKQRSVMKSNPNANRTANKLLEQVHHQYVNQFQLVGAMEGLDLQDDTRHDAIEATRKLMESNVDMKGMLGALLDITLDKHSSGDDANYVAKDEGPTLDKLDKNNWIDDTVLAAKPIISGPSGHTLRYLNFWKKKRDAGKDSEDFGSWPSLEAARLVMMADLMPPKHHSYDEIMTSSIGITDEASSSILGYEYKSNYDDLKEQESNDAKSIAEQAYNESAASEIAENEEVDKIIGKRILVSQLKAQFESELADKMSRMSPDQLLLLMTGLIESLKSNSNLISPPS